ncbi:16S rRNA (cytosine(967)-C(5))-methyltransferase RsmB [Marinobacterium sp. D7]|uniref:16S rRNA (cytosine(967)-C(5))-methyltransferase RsmB n=1 Tax=Marinobacterium ramblicola TaxID=2849041 RepID=UPI001C2D1EF9|nr:16S rRNA (cytosine(967)-C(5))-methyltransferase RsmB [Marinobacterium ramblicola]MBV1789313.1 16S rRNA (cytosine(967)-C(5))-methyltransferase RsmB [Marinobacterium ramblicola]
MNIRVLAARVLEPLINHRGSLKSTLPEALVQCPTQDRALLRQLCYGTLRDFYRLSAIANALLKRPLQAQDQDLQALLLVGLYQLRSMRIPAHAAVSETVEGTRELNKAWAGKLFNAVLRRYQREQEEIESSLAQDEQFQYNHPLWMIDKLRHNWPDHWQSILQENDTPGPMTLRVNERSLTREEAIKKLTQNQITVTPGQHSPQALTLAEAIDVSKLPGFSQGLLSVQDEAAQLACILLDAKPGQRVLDACAAPGGKLCHLLETQPSLCEAIAVEMEPSRLEKVRDNLERLKLSHECVLHLGDASARDWWNGTPFDRILVDAPCSGTGVIRRNPDIKLLRRNEDILGLANLQLGILDNLWQMLAPGGRLVYATCSVFPQENERIVERFVKLHADAKSLPVPLTCGIERPYGRQLFPAAGEHDGFYYAILTKDA